MTNTETAHRYDGSTDFTPAQKRVYRGDVAGFLADLAEVADLYNVVEFGKVLPGDESMYTGIYVLRRWDEGDQYVTHLMYRIDDRDQTIWAFSSGHYFRVAEFDSRVDALVAASADLAERS